MKTEQIISESIVEIYEKQQPALCKIIKEMVINGAKYNDFNAFMAIKFGKDYSTSITCSASLTIFKHYQKTLKLES